jgi:D-alanine-D-alanine ligase
MKARTVVGVVFGGMSAEHEVSCASARNVITAMDQGRYETVPLYIDPQGRWYLLEQGDLGSDEIPRPLPEHKRVLLAPDRTKGRLLGYHKGDFRKTVDILFPVLHGPYGEDGSFQGLCKLYRIPFVGAGVVGSAVSMDKDVMKRLLREKGIPVPRFQVVCAEDRETISCERICGELGLPLFVKPANLGSSVGITKVASPEGLRAAMETAWRYDRKILLEECIQGREIECSVLGNWDPVASLPGEILPRHDFYSYEAKYIDKEGALLRIPAPLPDGVIREVRQMAVDTFKALCCEGMARVDFFLRGAGELLVNELNSIPGFTNISMYPKLWEVSGISYSELIDRLIALGFERFELEMDLCTSRRLPEASPSSQ